MSELIFKNWKERCSSLGHILTNLPQPITDEEKVELANLLEECRSGVNTNGNKTKWTDTKAARVKALQRKEKGEDELSSGIITHLDDVFRAVFWKRRRHLANKYLEKGLLTEQDILDLASKQDGDFYVKNGDRFANDYIEGEWDNYSEKVRDTKSNYDLKTFDEAELTKLYENQLKGYSWLVKNKYNLDYYPEAELVYGLVNNPLHHITNEITRQFYAHGNPDEDNDKWIEVKRQIERNMIFDIDLFKRDYPHYIFENEVLDFDIPAQFRLKKFQVTTTQEDINNIKRRVLMCRIYLCNKELEIYNKLNQK
jgi:hypothetical protein